MTIGEEAQLEVPEIQQFRDQMIKTSIFPRHAQIWKKNNMFDTVLHYLHR